MESTKKTARIAGAIYLVVVLTGIFTLGYVPSKLIFWNDPAKTLQTITASAQLFRLAIAASIICYLAFLALPLVLYQLLHKVNEQYAKAMIILAMVSVPISLLNLQHQFDVLALIGGADLKMLSQQQLQERVLFSLGSYNNGLKIVQLFWGLWLFPFGYLVYHSGRLPKLLGILLMIGCFSYLINVFGRLLLPHYSQLGIGNYVQLPASIGEIGTCLWLLAVGIREERKPQ